MHGTVGVFNRPTWAVRAVASPLEEQSSQEAWCFQFISQNSKEGIRSKILVLVISV